MATVWKRWKSNDGFPPFPQRLGNLAEGGEIPTFPQLLRFVYRSTKPPRGKNWVRWKSGNPKTGSPLPRRTDGLRREEENPKGVYNAPGTFCIPCAGLDTPSCERVWVILEGHASARWPTRHAGVRNAT